MTRSKVKRHDLLRCQYNWLLAERFDWWEMNRTAVNACPLMCSIADAGIARFLNEILPYKAGKAHRPRRGFLGVRTEQEAGKQVIKVNPAGTSQHCAICLNRVSKELSDRWHECPHCGASMPRDLCSGILIKKVGLGIASLKNAKSRSRDGEARTLSKG